MIRVWNLRRMNSYTYEMFLETFEIFDVWIYTRMKCSVKLSIRVTKVKPGLYFSRRLSAAVAYSFVARAGDHGRHRQLSFKCARALRKYTVARQNDKMSHPRNSNSNANSNSNSNFFIELYLHREITLHVLFEWPHTLSACSYRVSLYAWVCTLGTGWHVLIISFNLFAVAFPWILLSVAFAIRAAVAYTKL